MIAITIKLDTLVHHVCEKTGNIHIPSVSAVYAQILTANGGKYPNILLLPELNGHENWTEELAWITANFGGVNGIPIMLDVFGGGSGSSPVPQLTTDQILAAMAVANVKWLRFAEVVSWYIEHSQTFPTAYVTAILNFCVAHNLRLFWTEWKVDSVFQSIQTYIAGFESIVTVSFSTNSGDLEPDKGFEHVRSLFTHWGGSVQSWYWETRHRAPEYAPVNDPQNMPVSWMIQHSCLCRNMGAELIQFEPYWYFFGYMDGVARESLNTLHGYVNSVASMMETSTVILQTIFAEWMNRPAKTGIRWFDGRVESDVNVQSLAISCYNIEGLSLSSRIWLKKETVAVKIFVTGLEKTQENVGLMQESMRAEVERIIKMYDLLAPLWDPNVGPTGEYHHRRIPGINDVMISRQSNVTDSGYARAIVQVTCKIYS